MKRDSRRNAIKLDTQNMTKLSLFVVDCGISLFVADTAVELGADSLKILTSLVNCWPHFVHDLMTYRWGSSSVPKFRDDENGNCFIKNIQITLSERVQRVLSLELIFT